MDDSELVARTRRGDHDAFARLVRRHQGIGHRVAYLVLRDEVEAEDVVQEAFVKAYRALGGFREGASFRTWFLTIVGNEARNRRR
ncbi:MAG: sigma-70 family RNA polymerase sigma factor, partial [Actinomycetota bacterium]